MSTNTVETSDEEFHSILSSARLDKREGRWNEALAGFDKALAFAGQNHFAAINIDRAICFTALGEGAHAAALWNELGVPAALLEGHSRPIVEGLPTALVGVRRDSSNETLIEWIPVAPLSPCHGVLCAPSVWVDSLELGDVVLWDMPPLTTLGEQAGLSTEVLANHERRTPNTLPGFALIGLLSKGDEPHVAFRARMRNETWVPWKDDTLKSHGIRWFLGESPLESEESREADERFVRGKMVCPRGISWAVLADHIDAQLGESRGLAFACPSVFERSGRTRAAGLHHQSFGAIERAAAGRKPDTQ